MSQLVPGTGGGGGNNAVFLPHLSNSGNQWYALTPYTAANGIGMTGTAGAATMYFTPFLVQDSFTISTVGIRVTTLVVATNAQVAIYSDAIDSSGAHRPAALQSASASMSMAAANAQSGLLGANVHLTQGLWWGGIISSDITSVAAVRCATSADLFIGSLIGSSTTVGNAFAISGVQLTGQTFGTWPANLSNSAFTEMTTANAVLIVARVASVP
jgi:hypothetical protein